MALLTLPSSTQTKYTTASHLLNILTMLVIPAIFPGQSLNNISKTTRVVQGYHKNIVIDHYNIIIYYSFNLLLFPHLSLFNKWGMFFVAGGGHVVCLKSSNDRDEFLKKQRLTRISYLYISVYSLFPILHENRVSAALSNTAKVMFR